MTNCTISNELEAARRAQLPTGAIAVRPKSGGMVAYLYDGTNGAPCAAVFFGRSAKTKDRYRFTSAERREAYVRRMIESTKARQEAQARRQAERKAQGRGLAVGDVLSASWGYDQTNIDWYEITALIGATMVEVRKIACEREETEWEQGKTVPAPGHYIGEPMRRKARNGAVSIDQVRYATKVEPMASIGGARVYAAAHYTSYH